MTDRPEPITSEDRLHTELQALLRRAHAGGTDVRGGWQCRNGPERPDWDVVVTEVEKIDDAD